MQGLLAGVTEELDRVSADAALRKKTSGELAKLLASATQATSIAHIAQARQAAEAAYDRALAAIEQAQAAQPKPDVLTATPSIPPVKKRRVVEAKSLWSGSFIETEDDMEDFLKKLRVVLKAALAANERVQIK